LKFSRYSAASKPCSFTWNTASIRPSTHHAAVRPEAWNGNGRSTTRRSRKVLPKDLGSSDGGRKPSSPQGRTATSKKSRVQG
jgi:hypothetical protein